MADLTCLLKPRRQWKKVDRQSSKIWTWLCLLHLLGGTDNGLSAKWQHRWSLLWPNIYFTFSCCSSWSPSQISAHQFFLLVRLVREGISGLEGNEDQSGVGVCLGERGGSDRAPQDRDSQSFPCDQATSWSPVDALLPLDGNSGNGIHPSASSWGLDVWEQSSFILVVMQLLTQPFVSRRSKEQQCSPVIIVPVAPMISVITILVIGTFARWTAVTVAPWATVIIVRPAIAIMVPVPVSVVWVMPIPLPGLTAVTLVAIFTVPLPISPVCQKMYKHDIRSHKNGIYIICKDLIPTSNCI